MGHLSVAAHDYLLTGERGRWAAGRGAEGVGARRLSRRPGIYGRSAPRVSLIDQVDWSLFGSRRPALFAVTRDGWGGLPEAPGEQCPRGARPGLRRDRSRAAPPATAPPPSLAALPLPSAPAGGEGRGVSSAMAHPPAPPQPCCAFVPGQQPSRSSPARTRATVNVCLWGSSSGTLPPRRRRGQDRTPRDISPAAAAAVPSAALRGKMFLSVASCSCTFLFNIHAPK